MHQHNEHFTLQAVAGIPKLRLQVRPGAKLNPEPLQRLLGSALPDNPQEQTSLENACYWLSPNDWLLLNPTADPDSIKTALQDACAHVTCAVTDVSDAWSVIDLSGAAVAAKLAQGCALDFDARAFLPGHYALTRLQHLAVIIHRLDAATQFRLLTDRSVARYLQDWLAV